MEDKAPVTNEDKVVKRVALAVMKYRPTCAIPNCKNACASRGRSKKTGEQKIGRFCNPHRGTYAAGAFLNREGKLARQRRKENKQNEAAAPITPSPTM